MKLICIFASTTRGLRKSQVSLVKSSLVFVLVEGSSLAALKSFMPTKQKRGRKKQKTTSAFHRKENSRGMLKLFLSLLSDSNQRPRDYKSRALAN